MTTTFTLADGSTDLNDGIKAGNAFMGVGGNTGEATFAHNTVAGTATSYAMVQSSTGRTILNSASGQSTLFRIGNSTTGQITHSSTSITHAPAAAVGNGFTSGIAFSGYWGGSTSFATFSHSSANTSTNYALIQNASGQTYLNSASGTPISLRIANNDIATIDTTALATNTIDSLTATTLTLGPATATAINIGASDIQTTVQNKIVVNASDLTAGAINRIQLFGTTETGGYGFGISGNTLSHIAGGTTHAFYTKTGGATSTLRLTVNDNSTTVPIVEFTDETDTNINQLLVRFRASTFVERASIGIAGTTAWFTSASGVGNVVIRSKSSLATGITIGHQSGTDGVANLNDGSMRCDGTGIYMNGVLGKITPSGAFVYIGTNGLLGTTVSSIRYKEDVQDMGSVSDRLMDLRPVTFKYINREPGNELDDYGLIAEEVDQVFPELVTRNLEGEIETVQYPRLITLMLNELIKLKRELNNLKNV